MTDPDLLSWLREAITGRLELAREACDGDSGEWFMGDKWNVYRAEDVNPSGDQDEHELVTYGNVKPQSLHIAANDPASAIARCEAELAILDLYAATAALVEHPPVMPEGHPFAGKVSARDYMDAKRELCVLEPVVRLLAAGYKHQPGYREEWAS